MSLELKNIAWQEKYRPDKLVNIVSSSKYKILNYLKNEKSIPNFLFSSRIPGTGKTTMGKIIIKELKCNYLILNSSDDRKIETVREKIKNFVITKSTNGLKKCVFLDECDGMTSISQQALRNMMETYSSNCFFILTCNYIDKIIEPLRSRCVEIRFIKPDKKEIYNYLENICKNEKLEFDEKGLNTIIELEYPSIRNMVNQLQDIFTQNKGIFEKNIKHKNDEFNIIWNLIKNLKFTESRKYIIKNNIDCLLLNRWLFYELMTEEIIINKLIKLIKIVADNEYKMKLGADTQIIFISSIVELLMVLK